MEPQARPVHGPGSRCDWGWVSRRMWDRALRRRRRRCPGVPPRAAQCESRARRPDAQKSASTFVVLDLRRGAATRADEEHAGVVVIGMGAGHERVAAFDAGHEFLLHQEIQGAIDGRRREPALETPLQLPYQVVGAQRLFRAPQGLQDQPSHRHEAQAARCEDVFCRRQSGRNGVRAAIDRNVHVQLPEAGEASATL